MVGTWEVTDFPNLPREGSTATMLDGPSCLAAPPVPDYCGKVLVAGGQTNATGLTATAELYDPRTGTWSPTGALFEARTKHTATLLTDGRVLVAGGSRDGQTNPIASAEVYDPTSETWGSAGTMNEARSIHTATLLDGPECRRTPPAPQPAHCGKVLLVGGITPFQRRTGLHPISTELYEPPPSGAGGTGTWTMTGPTAHGRLEHTATLLDGPACRRSNPLPPAYCGKVLVAGGSEIEGTVGSLVGGNPTAIELYDPATGNWLTVAPATKSRARHVAVLLDGPECAATASLTHCGKLLVAGGGSGGNRTSAELYDPAGATTVNGATVQGRWTDTGSMSVGRFSHGASPLAGPSCQATTVPDYCGDVLVFGGTDGRTQAELYDPTGGKWRDTGTPVRGRRVATATLMDGLDCDVSARACGRVLVIGGDGDVGSAELFNPAGAGQSPSVFDILPSSGPDIGGTAVTILGEGFTAPFTVRFGEDEAVVATLDSPTRVTATSPAHLAETVAVTVTTPKGTSAVINRTRFTFLGPDDIWSPSGALDQGRAQHTATLLEDGTALVAGGNRSAAERYDPAAVSTVDGLAVKGGWRSAGTAPARVQHTATLLQAGPMSGSVLVAGGREPSPGTAAVSPSTQLYDPTKNSWSDARPLLASRYDHTATLLEDGRVLVVGGRRALAPTGNVLNQDLLGASELYDPVAGVWHPAGTLATARAGHTATRLDGPACEPVPRPAYCGKVLVAGGTGGGISAELFDPATGLWVPAGPIATSRVDATATLLADGRVLLAGGLGASNSSSVVVEIYEPEASTTLNGVPVQGAWAVIASMAEPRHGHTAVLLQGALCGRNCGKVLVAGGAGGRYSSDVGRITLRSAEMYDPRAGRWEPTSALREARTGHTAISLADGTVLAVGGNPGGTTGFPLRSAEVFGPGPPLPTPSVVAVSPPSGPTFGQTRVLITGSNLFRSSAVHFGDVPARMITVTDSVIIAVSPPQPQGTVDVRVTTKGGASPPLAGARFTYAAGTWHSTAALGAARYQHGATRLDGRPCQATPAPRWCGLVLVFGGATSFHANDGALGSAELYDPGQKTWRPTGSLARPRYDFASATLPDGRVVVAGGRQGDANAPPVATAELYDPASESWGPAGALGTPRFSHTATVLADGRVLVAGGTNAENDRPALASAELFDPASGSWAPTDSFVTARTNHSATLLADGRVLVAGGLAGSRGGATALASAELFDPATGTWTATAPPAVARFSHSASLLDQPPCGDRCGQVLLAGGISSASPLSPPTLVASAELFDLATGTWSPAGSLGAARGGHTASLLSDGSVLVAGSGMTFPASPGYPTTSAELYRPTTGEWSYTSFMTVARGLSTTTLLDGPACRGNSPPGYCGSVLTAGGADAGGVFAPPPLAAAEFYVPAPRVDGLVPARGPESGGTSVVIKGSGFAGASSVSFGDTAVSGFTGNSPSRITAPSPSHGPGPVNVTVVNDGGTSATTATQPTSRFVFVTAPRLVGDLTATAVSDSSIDLAFTAPDDGSGMSPATSYLVKQSEQPIDGQAAFDGAKSLCGGRCAFPSAAKVILSVADLRPSTTYHYAVRAMNDEGLAGPISASASATTLGTAPTAPCGPGPGPGAGRVAYGAGYSLVGLPAGANIAAQSPLYSWFDQGAGGSYGVQAAGQPVEAGRGYWAWFRCPSLVELSSPGTPEVRFALGAYHASMVGNPSATSPATVTGHDFAARWDPTLNDGAGGYAVSGYREPQSLAVGEGMWTFAYEPTRITIAEGQ